MNGFGARYRKTRVRLLRSRPKQPFSVFEAFQPGENALSRMLAYLLDPLEGHGQGRAFLNTFLSLVKMRPRDCPVRVRTEHPCERVSNPAHGTRRIDILVWLDREHIGIESKPWAAEQDAQCGDYARELEAMRGDDWRLAFLTRDGRLPSSMTCEEHRRYGSRVVPLRYDSVAETFKACQSHSTAVKEFLEQFERYVTERINGETFMSSETKDLVNEFFKSDVIDVTAEFLAHANEIRNQMVANFREKMLARVQSEHSNEWEAALMSEQWTRDKNFDLNYSGLYFYKRNWANRFAVGFSNQRPLGRSMYFGIYNCGRKVELEDSGDVKGQLNRELSAMSNNTPYCSGETT